MMSMELYFVLICYTSQVKIKYISVIFKKNCLSFIFKQLTNKRECVFKLAV